MLYQVIEDGQIVQSYAMPDHDDTNHKGSAKRDVANGVAGLNGTGNILVPGYEIQIARNASNNSHIYERATNELICYWNRIGTNNYQYFINSGGATSTVQLANMKDIANGIAGLDVNKTINELHKITEVSANTTLDETYFTVLVDAVGGARTITLPAAASHTHRIYNIKKIDASGNAVTIDGAGAETIDGAATQIIAAQYDSYTIQSNGTGWFII